MAHYGGSYPPRQHIDAYRASPVPAPPPHRGMGGGGGPRGGRSYGFGPSSGDGHLAGPEIYGFEFTGGLPGFEGAISTAALGSGHGLTPGDAAPAPAAAYLALLCQESLSDFRQAAAWSPALVPAVETVLRTMAAQSTPTNRELQMRLHAMARLKDLAQSGIAFCVGLDLEPYGSFVSGLYTPQGDLDLSIEGAATWRDEAGRMQRVTVDHMEREQKVKFLRALASRIQAKRLSLGRVDRILHARVPILKFRDVSGLDFDVGIGGSQALFKSTMLGLLALFDWRVGALVRLVKLWARRHGVNDSTTGTLNSFALTLLVVFHLQTRQPAVLPPLCTLCGCDPADPRPMQDGRFPDWRLLSVACDRLSNLSRVGGPGGGNSETLLELLASFFSLYEGLLTGGWGAPKGADAGALRGVLRRVRVDTWAGALRHQAWDHPGYCMSVEDPFDSTDNCARTVRKEEKLALIAGAVARGRSLLLELEQPHLAEHALGELFGAAALHPRQLHDLLHDPAGAPAVQWVRPVDLVIPPRIQSHTDGRLPHAVQVNHQRRRGGNVPPGFAQPLPPPPPPRGVPELSEGLVQLHLGGQPQQLAAPPPPPPPPGLAPGIPVPGAVAAQQPAAFSLQLLREAMEPEVAEEAARLAELERLAAEESAEVAARRNERRAAKKAAAKAEQEAKRAARQQARAERGRSRSTSRSRSRGRGSRSGSATRSTSLTISTAVTAAVSNLGRASSLATTAGSSSSVAASSMAASSMAASSVAVGGGVPPTRAALAALADDDAFTAAADALSGSSGAEPATEPAVASAGRAAALAAEAVAGLSSEGGGSVGSGGGRRKQQKDAARQRKERRGGVDAAAGGADAAAPAPPPPPPPGLRGEQHPPQQGGQAAKPARHRPRKAAAGDGGGGAARPAVLVVPRRPPPPPPPLA